MKIYFAPNWNQYTFNSAFYEVGGKKYKIFVMEANNHLTFAENPLTLLLVPHDTVLAQQIKEMIDKEEWYHIFATSAENLKFKQNFWVEGLSRPNGLLIKDANQVEKIIGKKSKPVEPEAQQIAFKVVSQEKW